MNQPVKIDNFSKARAQLLLNHPFFASIVLSTEWIADEKIPTACTDMTKIWYNPNFFAALSTDAIKFVMVHEIMHIILMHGFRRGGRKPRRWNHAGDYAINQELVDSGLTMLTWTQALIDQMPDPKLYQSKLGEQYGLLDAQKYKGLAAEQIYDILEEENKKGKGKGKGKPGPGNGTPQPGDDDEADEALDDLMDAISDKSSAEINQAKGEIRQKIAQAATMARAAGKLPANIALLVDGVLNPPQPWEIILREYMTRLVHTNETWNRRNRRFSVVLPSRYDVSMGELNIIGDTSGSMMQDQIFAQIAREINHCNEFVKPERTRVVWADAEACSGEQVFELGEEVVLEPKGGGGTDMRLPLKHVEQFNPCCVILVTDAYTPWPDEPTPYPLIVACTTDAPCPDWALRLQLRTGE